MCYSGHCAYLRTLQLQGDRPWRRGERALLLLCPLRSNRHLSRCQGSRSVISSIWSDLECESSAAIDKNAAANPKAGMHSVEPRPQLDLTAGASQSSASFFDHASGLSFNSPDVVTRRYPEARNNIRPIPTQKIRRTSRASASTRPTADSNPSSSSITMLAPS
jgi:hypothetical protein